MQGITLSGGLVAYCRQGEGPPLLLLHGWGCSSRYWQATIASLADQRTVYALDLPGYGESPPWAGSPSIQSAAALTLEFADALGLDSFDINAHSFSTSVAVYLAIHVPSRIRRMVLTCASTYRNELERRVARQVHAVLALWVKLRHPWMGHVPLVYRVVLRRFFYQMPTDNSLLRSHFEEFLRMDQRTAIAHVQDVARIDYHAALRQVAVPTLVIGARQDAVMRASGTPHVAQLIPNSRLSWIEQCGHIPMFEQPDIYHRLLREFLL